MWWEGVPKYLLWRSQPLKRVLLSLPQPRCSLKSKHCGFKAIVPDPHHTHIFVLSLHSQCQAVTSTTVSGTRWSLLLRKKGARGRGTAWREHKSHCVPGGRVPRTSSAMLYLLLLCWYEGHLPCPSAACSGSASLPAAPLITRGR